MAVTNWYALTTSGSASVHSSLETAVWVPVRGAVRGVLVGTAAVAREAACWPQQGRVRPQGRDEPRHPLGTKVAVKPF